MSQISLPLYGLLYLVLCLLNACTQVSSCNSTIYCTGELLHTVQLAKIFGNSRTFVDLKLTKSPKTILRTFEALMTETDNSPTSVQIRGFLEKHFEDKEELRYWRPTDFTPFPPIISQIKNPDLLQFAKDLISIWSKLGRKVSKDVFKNPKLYSFLYVPRGFIVPSENYKEMYYWDSYWIIRGLLMSNMIKTVKGMIENFLYLVVKFGYVPSGTRIYYLGRSQPPFLSWMVYDYFTATGDKAWLEQNIATVETELTYWLKKKTLTVELKGSGYTLLRYASDKYFKGPRPESYNEDYMNAQKVPENIRELFYMQIKSAVESGWDFSSRWLVTSAAKGEFNLTDVSTTKILPVDLNAIFAAALQKAGNLRDLLGHHQSATKWWNLAEQWRDAIDNVLWDSDAGVWYDFDSRQIMRRKFFYISCAAPLWAGAVEPWLVPERARYFVRYLESSGALRFPGGIPTSLWHTGEQYDYPNVWPPLQAMMIGALENSDYSGAKRLARHHIQLWIRAMYAGFKKYKRMFDNYNCLITGEHGSRTDYSSQYGFGWTNAYTLELLQKYGSELTLD